ncbi:lipopolysaccharide biosynthesis protein [Paraburkholderia aspalathi]|uniref:lipopolysaccharide biosynthesis protein n=1 Tax=Paraburkholderia aspalathi TaxID=1324617 RepID=UPI0038B9C71A
MVVKTATVNIVVMAANALGMIVCARILGADSRGVLASWMIWPPVISALLSVGTGSAFVYFSKRDELNRMNYVRALVSTSFVLSLVAALVTWTFASTLYGVGVDSRVALKVWLCIYSAFMVSFSVLSGIAQSTATLELYNLTRLIPSLTYLIAGLGLYAFGTVDTQAFLIIYILGYALAASALAWSAIRAAGYVFRVPVVFFSNLITHGARFCILDTLGVVSGQVDKMFLTAFLPPYVLGIYAVAFGLSRILAQLQLAIATIIFPRTAGKEPEIVARLVAQAFRVSMAVSTVLGIVAVAVGRFVIVFLYGNQFASSYPIFTLLVIESILSGGGWILSQAFNAIGRTELVVFRQIGGLAATCLALFFLIPKFGAEGAAMGLLCGSLVRLIMTMSAYPIVLKTAIPRVLPDRQDVLLFKTLLKIS